MYTFAKLVEVVSLIWPKYQILVSLNLPNACGRVEDAYLKVEDGIFVNKWFGGAGNSVGRVLRQMVAIV